MWLAALLTLAMELRMPAGDVALYREVTGGTAIDTTGVALTFDTVDEEARGSFEISGTDVTVKEACRVLYFGGMSLIKGSAGAETVTCRLEMDPNTGTFAQEPQGNCYGFYQDADGVDNAPLAIASVVNCVANAKLRFVGMAVGANVTEVANRSYLQLYRLPDTLQIFSAFRNSNINNVALTYTDIGWNTETVKDSSWGHSTTTNPEQITWNGPDSRVLLLMCVTFTNATGGAADRMQVGAHVLKNGTAMDFTQSCNFIRGTGGDINISCRVCIPIDLVTGDVLKVQGKIFVRPSSQTVRIQPNRTAITLIAIPSNVNWIRIRNASDQGVDSTIDLACDTEDQEDGAFAHSGSSSEFTLNRARHTVLGHHVSIDRTSGSSASDITWEAAWRKNNSSNLPQQGNGAFTEGAVSTLDYKDAHLAGACIFRPTASDVVELRVSKIGTGTDAASVALGGTGETKSLIWAFDLDDLTGSKFPAGGDGDCQCALRVGRSIQSQPVGEGTPSTQISVGRSVPLTGVGAGDVQLPIGVARSLTAPSGGAGDLLLPIGIARSLSPNANGESVPQLSIGIARSLSLSLVGESGQFLALRIDTGGGTGVDVFLNAQALGEGVAQLALSAARSLAVGADGASDVRLAPGVALGLKAAVLGEALPRAILGIARLVTPLVSGEAVTSLAITRGQALSLVAGGESNLLLPLTRAQHLQMQSVGEAVLTALLRRELHLTPQVSGEALTQIAVGVARLIRSSTLGEAHTQAIVLNAILNRFAVRIEVRRTQDRIEVVRAQERVEVARTVMQVKVPDES